MDCVVLEKQLTYHPLQTLGPHGTSRPCGNVGCTKEMINRGIVIFRTVHTARWKGGEPAQVGCLCSQWPSAVCSSVPLGRRPPCQGRYYRLAYIDRYSLPQLSEDRAYRGSFWSDCAISKCLCGHLQNGVDVSPIMPVLFPESVRVCIIMEQ